MEESRRFREAQQRFVDEKASPLGDLRSGLFLGKEALSEEMLERVRREGSREKPQGKELLRQRRGVKSAVFEVLEELGEKDPASVLKIGKRLRPNRDVAIFVLWRQGIYTNREIGEMFGIGYTAGQGRQGGERNIYWQTRD
jgi:hypothetical protein